MAGGVCGRGVMHGRGASMAGGWGMCGGHAWQEGMRDKHTPSEQILRLWHTVNERAVRILLECILVCHIFSNPIYLNPDII